MSQPAEDRPIEIPEAPEGEDISTADAAERLDLDPDEQPNYTDQESEKGPDRRQR